MKYIVELKYTNPAHEHVSLRRRVDTVTRLVEATSEDQAILRAANQQRALGFMVKEAKVVKEKNHDKEGDEETVVAEGTESYPTLKPGQKLKPVKLKMGEGFDPEPKDIAAHLVGKHGKGKVTKDHVDAYEKDRDSNKGIDKEAVMKHVQKMSEEVEQIDEVKTANPGRGYHGEHPADKADVKYAEMHAKLLKTAVAGNSSSKKIRNYLDSTHGRHLAGHENDSEYIAKDFAKFDRSYKPEMFKEEQIDELKKSTLASYVKKKHDQYHKNRMIAKTQKQVDWLQKDANKNLARAEKRLDAVKTEEVEQIDEAGKGYSPGWMLKHPDGKTLDAKLKAKKELETKRQKAYGDPNAGVSVKTEEVEQIDELKKSTLASYVKGATRDVASASRLQRGYETDAARSEFAPVRRGSELAAKNMRKFAGKRSRGIARAVDKLAKEEVVTEAEREAGYKMPAHVAAGQKKFDAQAKGQNKPRPQAGTLAAKKIKEAAEKMVKKVRAMKDDKKSTKAAEIKLDNEKKKVNKINMEPSVEVKG